MIIELIFGVIASVSMFEVFFLHFSEVTLQALFICTTSKLLQCTKDTLKDTLKGTLKDTLRETLQETLKATLKDTITDTLKVALHKHKNK